MGSFLDFIIDIGWATIASLGFAFNGLGLDIVISISSTEGVGTGVFNTSSLLHSKVQSTSINQ